MKNILKQNNGFSLIELMIAMLISSVVISGIFLAYRSQNESYHAQEQVAGMQQTLRSTMYLIVRGTRMAGYDPDDTLNAGITVAEDDTFTFTRDDGTGTLDTITYSYDSTNKTLDRKIKAGNAQTAAENIVALGFAYAFDNDGDGALDTYSVSGTPTIYWAVDSDSDNDLDRHLDTQGDGVIDVNDDTDGDDIIDGQALPTEASFEKIRAVKIWILARSDQRNRKITNTATYIVGNTIVKPATDSDNKNRRMRLLSSVVQCRNMGLD